MALRCEFSNSIRFPFLSSSAVSLRPNPALPQAHGPHHNQSAQTACDHPRILSQSSSIRGVHHPRGQSLVARDALPPPTLKLSVTSTSPASSFLWSHFLVSQHLHCTPSHLLWTLLKFFPGYIFKACGDNASVQFVLSFPPCNKPSVGKNIWFNQ